MKLKGEKKLRIAISIWDFTPNTGGLQAHAESLCRYLKKNGHEVEVITRSATYVPEGSDYLLKNESFDHTSVNGIEVKILKLPTIFKPLLRIALKLHHRKYLSWIAVSIFKLAVSRSSKKAFGGYDLIHHIGHATALEGFAAVIGSKYHKIPLLIQPTCHPFHFGDSQEDFWIYKNANRLLVHTEYERQFFCGKGIECPIDVVGNGIEDKSDGDGQKFKQKYGINGDIILYLGRKSEDKGYFLLHQAHDIISKHINNVMLVCIGPGNPIKYRENNNYKLDLGYVTENEKHDALDACTILCVPSESESFGLVYMEAGRYRKPIVARAIPVLKELLKNGEAGVLLSSSNGNDPRAQASASLLAEALGDLLKDKKKQQYIGDNLYNISSNYIWENIINNFTCSYKKSLK
jgi:glycosyltransferase involved in cell wall biosynthesis